MKSKNDNPVKSCASLNLPVHFLINLKISFTPSRKLGRWSNEKITHWLKKYISNDKRMWNIQDNVTIINSIFHIRRWSGSSKLGDGFSLMCIYFWSLPTSQELNNVTLPGFSQIAKGGWLTFKFLWWSFREAVIWSIGTERHKQIRNWERWSLWD